MEAIKKIIELVSTLVGISAAMIAVLTGAFGVYTYFRDSRRKLFTETMAEYKKLQEEVFDKLNDWTGAEQVAEAADSPGTYGHTELNNALARIEHFCVGINRGVYDFETFYQLSHGYFDLKLQKLLEPLLDIKLNKYEDEVDFYNNLHKVWARMKERSNKPL